MISINKNAVKIVKEVIENADNLGVKVSKTKAGVTIIDMGLDCPGSWEAGILLTRITIGDLGIVKLGEFPIKDYTLASADVYVKEPLIACVASQIAGWQLGEGEFATIGSGPARAIAAVESDFYMNMTPYRDKHDEVVLSIQDVKLPDETLGLIVAEKCNVKPEDVYLAVAPSTALVTAIQVSARTIEQTCHKMYKKGFDVSKVVCARGTAPIPPIVLDEVKAMGRLNDALLYGGIAEFWVDASDDEIAEVVDKLVSQYSSPYYGALFGDVFEKANCNFYEIDHDFHCVAKIQIHNVRTGKAFTSGEIRYDILKESFFS